MDKQQRREYAESLKSSAKELIDGIGTESEKETFATEIINEAVKQRNRWRLAAVISIALNIIQWFLCG